MSDVEQGGSTVFTYLDTTIKPMKGTAAFWYNLHSSGQGDHRTRHAACPVLSGNKWGNVTTKQQLVLYIFYYHRGIIVVSNMWLHEQGQEFRRPCGSKPESEGDFLNEK